MRILMYRIERTIKVVDICVRNSAQVTLMTAAEVIDTWQGLPTELPDSPLADYLEEKSKALQESVLVRIEQYELWMLQKMKEFK